MTASRHELKPCVFMIGNLRFHELNCPVPSMPQAIHEPKVQFMVSANSCPQGQFIVLQEITKNAPQMWSIFCIRPKVEIISWSFSNTVGYREYRGNTCDIVDLSCDFVRYREYREYHRIKCCTKFAPKSHQRLTPIQLDKLELG